MQVRFALLSSLVASGPRREPWRTEALPGLIFGVLHLLLVASVALGAPELPSGAALLESVTYLDIPTPAAPTSPRAEAVKPRPVVVSQAVKIPAVESEVTRPDQAAGFQELLAPRELKALPPPDRSGPPVDERDFSGRGVAGGVAGGKPPPALPPDVAAALAAEGRITDVATRQVTRAVRPVEMDAVEIKPQLLNRERALDLLQQHWPAVLRQAGIEGDAIVQFVVDSNGAVVNESIQVLMSSHPLFANSVLPVVRQLRFSPGRMSMAGQLVPVPVTVRAPFKWSQVQE
jgi:protein TonB